MIKRQAWRLLHPCHRVWQLFFGTRGVLCLIEHEDSIVFVRHTYGDRSLWQLPGGRKKWRESARKAMLRELEEELGIVPEDLSALGGFELYMGRRATHLDFFTCTLGKQTIRPDCREIASFELFPHDEPPDSIGPGSVEGLRRWRTARALV